MCDAAADIICTRSLLLLVRFLLSYKWNHIRVIKKYHKSTYTRKKETVHIKCLLKNFFYDLFRPFEVRVWNSVTSYF